MGLKEFFGEPKRNNYVLTPVGISIYIPIKEPIDLKKILLEAQKFHPDKEFNLDGFVEVFDERTEENFVYVLPFRQ